jgi:glycyl-tRNA synthetase
MTSPLDFQSIIMTLQHFWADHGCLIWQPYYQQVGAGTLNPATALRVLGPEPWNVAFVEPSIRPDDGRYGENPNRMQMHYQFQVVLKPDPGNAQELYIASLAALGIDPLLHDLRFVEDNWESPALGAWGLGWEVWLDGQEITQYTYFQQAGGQSLNPVSVELTYGLDRIAIALQRVHGFQDIIWNLAKPGSFLKGRTVTAGEVNLQAEQEHSQYYFEVADVNRLGQMFDLYEAESNAALDQGLILPAYDYILKCSHTFNVLDSRGAIGVTERQAFFGRMRNLSRKVAELYLDQRQHLEFPWLDESKELASQQPTQMGRSYTDQAEISQHEQLLLEIGTEELPAGDLDSAITQLEQRFPAWLEEIRLDHGEIKIFGTPRRLVVSVAAVAPKQLDQELVVKGPPANRAFDATGQPTPAAEGFARSKGVSVSDLQIREIEGGQYAVAVVRSAGKPAKHVLAETLPSVISSLRFDKSMRWNSSNVAFSRPIRWFLALYGDHILPFEYAGLLSGRETRGLRFTEQETFTISNPAHFFSVMDEQGIILDGDQRRKTIESQIQELARKAGFTVETEDDLLSEVTNLVENPYSILGSFEADYLSLPPEVLISVMKKHQRYFPVEKDNKLVPYFITVCNHRKDVDQTGMELILEGNEHVIRARFADAAFFVKDDLQITLESYIPRLSALTFQTQIGSMLDKTYRIEKLVGELAGSFGLDEKTEHFARRAALLCKADLVTKMVIEMTSLQGVLGRYYALGSGEPKVVADAVFEHYLPRYAGDKVPGSLPGLTVGIADRLDTLVGLFAAGLAPTGAKDPFGQRRAALGLVNNLIAWEMDFDLRYAIDVAAENLPISSTPEIRHTCLAFIVERLRYLLLERGLRYDAIAAVLESQGWNPAGAAREVKSLMSWVLREDWNRILPAYARCMRITRDQTERFLVDPDLLTEPAEIDLFRALLKAEHTPRRSGSVDDFLNALLPLIPPIDRFFDEVLVMTDDATIQHNRLGLLQRLSLLADGVADMSKLEGF